MKKIYTSLCLAAATLFGMQAQVYILGNVGDQGWDPSVGTEMTSSDGVIYTYTGEFNASSYFSFTTKLASSSSAWDEINDYRVGAPWNNYELNKTNFDQVIVCNEMGVDTGNAFLLTSAGNYTLTFDLENLTLKVHPNGEIEEEVITPDGLYVMGQVNGQNWNTNEGTKMTTTDNVVYTTDIAIAEGGGTFSFTQALSKTASNWAGIAPYRFGATYNEYPLVDELGTAVALGEMGSDYSFSLPEGYYNLVVDLTARTLVATTTGAPAQKYYAIGTSFGNWDPANPTELVKDGDIYSCKATIDGDSYFVLTGAKGSWDAINAFRFGPLDTNTAIEVGVDVTTQLSTNSDAAYIVTGNGGEYILSFNPTALTFKIEPATAPGIVGDVDGNGAIDLNDMNIIINIMLGKADVAGYAADVDGNGAVDLTDMNKVINLILGK